MDTKFLNYSNSPIVLPLQKSLNIQYTTTTSSKLMHRPSLNLQDTVYITLLARNIPSHTHPLKTLSQLSKNSFVQQTLPHDLRRKYHFPLLASPICRFRSKTTSYSLINSPQSLYSYLFVTSSMLNYTAPSLCTLLSPQMARTNVFSSRNIQTTSIKAMNSDDGVQNGMIIHNARTPTISLMDYAFSSNPTKLLTAPYIFNE